MTPAAKRSQYAYENIAEAFYAARALAKRDGTTVADVLAGKDWLAALTLFDELILLTNCIRAFAEDRESVADEQKLAARSLRKETCERIAVWFDLDVKTLYGLEESA